MTSGSTMWLHGVFWCGLATLCSIHVDTARPFLDHPTCPRDPEVAKQRRCFKKCLVDNHCKAKRKCMCDGPCGMVCVKSRKRCKPPVPVLNGRLITEQAGNLTFGSKIRYTCAEGYILSGDSERQCQADSTWSGEGPTCETEARCRDAPWVPHANHNGPPEVKIHALGTQLIYRCDKGYNMEGFHRTICMGEGRWVGPRMTCSPLRCGHPGNILHADREGNVFVYPFRVKYICRNGYRMVGNINGGTRKCQQNGQWSGTPPTCIPIKCSRLATPSNGSMIGSDITYGARVHFFCNEGYFLEGSAIRSCRMDTSWSGKLVSCKVVDCGTPGPLHNGYLEIDGTTYKSKLTFKCNGRTTFEGVGTQTRCQQNGTWSVGIPKCWKQCLVPGVANGTIIGHESGVAFADHGKKINFHCDEGHIRNTTEGPRCHNGSWTFHPQCSPAPCAERPDEIRDGHVRFYTMAHGDKARYKCNTGYFLVGREFVICHFGQWRGKIPECSPVFCEHPGSIANGTILLVGVIGKYEYRPYVKNVWHNQEIEYHCDKEFKRVGPAAATCVGGRWSPTNMPKCVQKRHPKILYIFRGKRSLPDSDEALKELEMLRVSKKTTQFLQQPAGALEVLEELRIPDDAYLNEEKGLCEVPDIPHGHAANDPTGYYVPHTSVLDVTCDVGYMLLLGKGNSECNDGTWTWVPGCLPASGEMNTLDNMNLPK